LGAGPTRHAARSEAKPSEVQVYQALGWLLSYPERDWLESLPELETAIAAEGRLEPGRCAALLTLTRELRERPLLELQERYVSLFDRSTSLSLHLFEHVHGESRARGAAMAQLAELYARAELCVEVPELPDYLPLVCEFLAAAPPAQGQTLLADAAEVLARLEKRLAQRGSAYAAVLGALCALAGAASEALDEKPRAEREPNPFVAADREWTEEEVVFGPGAPSSAPAEVIP
jgi:nitrate reductase delta subunit